MEYKLRNIDDLVKILKPVTPAKAGVYYPAKDWIPAFAGMTRMVSMRPFTKQPILNYKVFPFDIHYSLRGVGSTLRAGSGTGGLVPILRFFLGRLNPRPLDPSDPAVFITHSAWQDLEACICKQPNNGPNPTHEKIPDD